MVVVEGQSQLFEMIFALYSPGRFARLWHRGQHQGNQHADDRDHEEKFDQGEASSMGGARTH